MTDTTESTPSPGERRDTHDALPEFLVPFAAMHDAMRRDVARLERAVLRVDDPADAQALRRWWQRVAGIIVHHHHREDGLVWPALQERADTFATDRAPLDDDHAALDRALDEVDRVLAAMADRHRDPDLPSRTALQASGQLRSLLTDHLRREEALAFPLLAERFTAAEYASLEREMRKGSSLRSMSFELPWVLDGADPRAREAIDRVVPGAIRLVLRLSWQRRYDRLAGPVCELGR